jgi:peptide-methionine (S)-S-oxide reductase
MRRSLIRSVGFIALPLIGLLVMGPRLAGAAPTPAKSVAVFAGGCFWSMQKAFDGVAGVLGTTVGYAGGTKANPTYHEVGGGDTGHAESVQVVYDPARVSYQRLLDIYWHHIDPLTVNAAFCDHGAQYRSIIFYGDAEQRRLAEASKRDLDQSHRFATPVVTTIQPSTTFYPGEEYHQQYYKKNPESYQAYVIGCGREQRLREIWGESQVSGKSGVGSQESGVAR